MEELRLAASAVLTSHVKAEIKAHNSARKRNVRLVFVNMLVCVVRVDYNGEKLCVFRIKLSLNTIQRRVTHD